MAHRLWRQRRDSLQIPRRRPPAVAPRPAAPRWRFAQGAPARPVSMVCRKWAGMRKRVRVPSNRLRADSNTLGRGLALSIQLSFAAQQLNRGMTLHTASGMQPNGRRSPPSDRGGGGVDCGVNTVRGTHKLLVGGEGARQHPLRVRGPVGHGAAARLHHVCEPPRHRHSL